MTACRKGDQSSIVKLLRLHIFLISRFIFFDPSVSEKGCKAVAPKNSKNKTVARYLWPQLLPIWNRWKWPWCFDPPAIWSLAKDFWEWGTHKLPVQLYHTKGGQWQTSIFCCVFQCELIQQQAILVPNAGDSSAFWCPQKISSILALGFF